jgi:hypothetical protein
MMMSKNPEGLVPIGEKRREKQLVLFCPRCKEKTVHNGWIQGKHIDASYRHCYQCTKCNRLEQWAQPEDRKLAAPQKEEK